MERFRGGGSSSSEIQNAIQRIYPEAPERRRPLFPWFRKPLQKLPSFVELGEDLQLNDLLAELVRHYLERALEEAEGNKTKAAELVGLSSYQTLTNWMERYGVKPLKRSRSR